MSRPSHPFHRFLFWLSQFDGRIGASAGRKLNRRRTRASLADFDRRLAALSSSDVCLDFGANMGLFTEKMAATGATVHAFEPDPHCFAILQAKFAGRSNIHLHNAAVARTAGQATLRRTLDFARSPDLQSQGSSIAGHDPALYQADGITVETRAFVDVVNGFDRPVALVKMDIEGSEFEILAQILEAPERFHIKAMFVETHERLFPESRGMVRQIRKMNWDGALPYPVDTFWP